MKNVITKKARYLGLKLSALLCAMLLISIHGVGQPLLNENFSYTVGTALSTNGWAVQGVATPTINVTTASISYPGYLSSGIGDEVTFATSGQDVNKSFTGQTSGVIYTSCLINVTSSTTTGEYFFHLGASTIGTTFHGRVFIKKDATSTNFAFGISKAGAIATAVFTPYSYSVSTTYLLVLKYTILSGTGNDYAAIYINPVLNAVEPVTGWTTSTDNTAADLANIGSVALRQGSASNSPVLKLDGIRVATTWADIVGAASINAPIIQSSSIGFPSVGQNQMTVNWTNGDGSKRIVIMNTTNSFTDPTDGTDPTANTVYSGSGEQVVYNNSSNSFTVTGLSNSTTYWFRAYEYNGSGATTKYLTSAATNNPNSQITAAPSPLILLSTNTLSGFTYVYNNGPSTPPQSFTISGANLTGDISISAPTNYEISSGSGFGTSLTLLRSEGIVGSTTIYVQLKAGLGLGNYNGETITASSAGASDEIVTCSGIVTQDCTPVFPFYEDFPSAAGSILTNNCWTAHSGAGASPITVAASTISYPGYLSSGVSNEVSLATTGEDVNRTFVAQNSGIVYVSFLVNISSATTTGDYFFNLGQTVIGGNYKARIFVKNDGTGNIAFGISQSTSAANYTPYSYSLGTTYLIAIKYSIISGVANDISSLIVNPAFNTMEPISGWYANTDASGTDLTELGSVALRQGTTAIAPTLKLDGIRISKSWSNIVGLPPAPLTYAVIGSGAYCQDGSGSPVGVSNSETGVTYELWKDGAATGLTIIGSTGNSISFGNQTIGDYTVKGTNEGGTTVMTGNAVITVNPLPTISLTSSALLIAAGTTSGSLIYSGTTNGADTYSIDFDAAANTMGFVDVTNVPFSGGTLGVTIPAGAGATDYNATLTVRNSTTGCVSNAYPIVITVAGFAFTTTQDIGTTLKVTWTSQPSAYLYAFEYRVAGNTPWLGISAPTNTVKVTNLLPNTNYECHVRIYKNGVLWGYSQIGTFTTANVTYTKTQDIGTTALMSWNSFAFASGYTLQYRKIGTPTWVSVASATNSAKMTNLLPNTDYECQVRVNVSNTLWGTCQLGTFHTGTMGFSTSQDIGTTLLMSWTPVSWASNVTLQYRPLGGSSWTAIGTTAGQVKVGNLQADSDYEFRLYVYKSGLLYGVSAISTIHTGAVAFTTVVDNNTSMDLTWLPSMTSWATSYQMQYCIGSENPAVSWVSMTTSSNTTLSIFPIVSGQDYWVKMRVMIGGVLWGTTKEQKIGRSTKEITVTENSQSETGMNVYPNPFVEQINMAISTTKETSCSWLIYDMTGKVVIQGTQSLSEGENTFNIEASGLTKGVYLLNVLTDSGKQSFRIVKQ